MATDREGFRRGPGRLSCRTWAVGLTFFVLLATAGASPAAQGRTATPSPSGTSPESQASQGSTSGDPSPRFVEQGLEQLGSPFTRDTVLRLNAIVARSLSAIEQFDRARMESGSNGGAERSASLRTYAELSRQAEQARIDMAAAGRQLRASGEAYNEAILAAMIRFVEDVDEEIGEEVGVLQGTPGASFRKGG